MEKLLFFLTILSAVPSCVKETPLEICDIEGRWVVEINGQANTLYEFHEGLRYTIYTDSVGVFGSRDEAIPNPNEYIFIGNELEIDLNFGNISIESVEFKCNCNVISFNDGESEIYVEGYDPALCDE